MEDCLKQRQRENDDLMKTFLKKKLYLNRPKDEAKIYELFGDEKEYRKFLKGFEKRKNSYANYHSMTLEEFDEKIRKYPEAYYQVLSVNAKRQNCFEKQQKELIKNIFEELSEKYEDLKFLPCSNFDKFFITDEGQVEHHCSKNRIKNLEYESKSFDYVWNVTKGVSSHKIIFYLKYTKENGGMQDDIKLETIETIKKVKKCNKANCFFIFLLDGEFWEAFVKTDNEGKNFHKTDSNNIKDVLDNIIKNF